MILGIIPDCLIKTGSEKLNGLRGAFLLPSMVFEF
jgi:hypothetical protein